MEITAEMTALSCPDGIPYFLEEAYLREAAELCSLCPDAFAAFMQEAKELRSSREATEKLWHAHYMLNIIGKTPVVERRPDFFMTYAVLAALPRTRAFYQMHNIPLQLLKDCAQDLQIWAVDCHEKTGKWGNMTWLWLKNTFNPSIFRLGRLQFEVRQWDEDSKLIRRKGSGGLELVTLDTDADSTVVMQRGDMYINVHIPALAPLDYDECQASLRSADVFYSRYFPHVEAKCYACTSWLMDRQLAHCLPESSNILRFQTLFEDVPNQGADDRQHRERIFGNADVSLDKAPRRTSLQRNFIACLEQGIKFGQGKGIIVKKQS